VEEAAQTIHSRALSGRQLFSPVSRDGEIRSLVPGYSPLSLRDFLILK
jgi:hypothetical protein